MRRVPFKAKRDESEKDIVKALRAAGATVYLMDKPLDLLVGHNGATFLAEVKNPDKASKLNDKQAKFVKEWRGQVDILRTPEDGLRMIGVLKDG